MTAQELAAILRESGMDETVVNSLVTNAKFQERAAQVASRTELEQIQQRESQLSASLQKSKTYEDWYNRNFAAIAAQQTAIAAYEERFGPLNGQPQQQQQQPTYQQQQQQPNGKQFTEAEVKEIIRQEMTGNYGALVTQSIVGTGKIVERHVRSGRKNEIDWGKIQELATSKNGDVEAAYNEWDAPERLRAEEEAYKAKLKADVDKEVERRMMASSGQFIPGGAGSDYSSTPSPLSTRTGDAAKTYDRAAVLEAANSVLRSPDYKPGWAH